MTPIRTCKKDAMYTAGKKCPALEDTVSVQAGGRSMPGLSEELQDGHCGNEGAGEG